MVNTYSVYDSTLARVDSYFSCSSIEFSLGVEIDDGVKLQEDSLNPGIQLSGKHSSCRKTGPRTDGFVQPLVGQGARH